MRIVFLEPARMDVRRAHDWYEARQEGLGKKFVQEVIDRSRSLIKKSIEYRRYFSNILSAFIKIPLFIILL